MKKKCFLLALTLILVFSTSILSYAAGNTSKIEKKWLDFYKALMEQKVKDQVISKEDAKERIAELEKQIRESEEDIIYRRFSYMKGKTYPKKENRSYPKKQQPKRGSPVTDKERIEKLIQRQEKFIKIYAELTQKSVDDIKTKCEEQDKTIWQLAHSEGELNRFKEAVIADAKADIQEKVEKGEITKEKGEEIIARITDHIGKIGF